MFFDYKTWLFCYTKINMTFISFYLRFKAFLCLKTDEVSSSQIETPFLQLFAHFYRY